ncbi:hypothetical protein BG841_14895 [Marinobacter sp. X15-166B]|nr:hypothetical protein BG841_14895 [Marinobacter sp. X15-166B]
MIVSVNVFDDSIKPMGKADTGGNPVKCIADSIKILVTGKPVIVDDPLGYPGHAIRHQCVPCIQIPVDLGNKSIDTNAAEPAPVAQQIMIEQHVQSDPGKPAPGCGKQMFRSPYLWVSVGVYIHGTMVCQSLSDRQGKTVNPHAAGKVTQQAAHPMLHRVGRQKQMCQIIQE